jgi:catechol 2,3-dioxygenase-like lactoylglutathione lyase family enzyme
MSTNRFSLAEEFTTDVPPNAAVDFYTTHLGFTLNTGSPAFADVVRGPLRLLLSGPASSGARATPARPRPPDATAST